MRENNTTGGTNGAETAYPSRGAIIAQPRFLVGYVLLNLLCFVYCFVDNYLHFVIFLLPIVHCNKIKKYIYLGDNCIVFENFTASIGDLMVTNRVDWRRVSGYSEQIFATIKSTILQNTFTRLS